MGNGEKAADVNRDEDGSCSTGGADSKSSGQVKRQADNHHVKRPAKKERRSEDELHSDLYGSCSTGGAIRMDSNSSGQGKRKADDLDDDEDGDHQVFYAADDLDAFADDDSDADHQVFYAADDLDAFADDDSDADHPVFYAADDLDAFADDDSDADHPVFYAADDLDAFADDDSDADHPVFYAADDLDAFADDDSDADHPVFYAADDLDAFADDDEDADHPVFYAADDLDGVHETEMKCDSEGSNEMAGGLISWGQCRKARCSGPFVVGSVKFKDCDGNVINCIEGKQIRFDVDTIYMIDSDNPSFILLVEKRSVAKNLYRALFDRGYRCIIVATVRRSLDDATKTLVCKLRMLSQVFVLFDYSPHFKSILFDLIHTDRMDLIWLGIRPDDARVLSQLAIHNLSEKFPTTYTESAQYKALSEISYYDCVPEPFGVPIKAFPADTLIHYYLPKLLSDSGVPGVEDI